MEKLLRFAQDKSASVNQAQLMGIIFAVLLVVVGLVMLPLVLDQTTVARQNANIGYYAGTQSIIDLIPLLYSVSVLGLAGFVTLITIKGKTG